MSPYTTTVFAMASGLFAVLVLFFASPFVAAAQIVETGSG